MKTLIEIKDLNFQYENGVKALKDINLKIYKGEKIALLGNNGAGKTTFFLILNGILKPQEGLVYYNGDKIGYTKKELLKLRRDVGIVFQNPEIQIIAPTVFQEVSFGPMNLKLPKNVVYERTKQAMKFLNIEELSERSPQYVSGGEKKRIGIADVIAMESKIILFDEPTANMDCTNVLYFENLLSEIHNEGKTLLISTHDIDFAVRWADRIILFQDGKIIGDGNTEEICSDEKLLTSIGLKKPILFSVIDILKEKGIVDENEKYVNTLNRLSDIITFH